MSKEKRPSPLYWELGKYEVYPAQRILRDHNGNDIAIEPRAIEALSLLCERQGEYVTTSTFLELIWEGRIVSDSAVRGTIRKLRAALRDNTKQPEYIQSSPKRGYRLIKHAEGKGQEGELFISDNHDNDDGCIKNQLKELSPAVSFPPILKHNAPRTIPLFLIGFAAAVVTTLLVFLQSPSDTNISPLHDFQSKIIPSLPGDKYDFSISEDGRWVAFSGRLDTHDTYQLYLVDTRTGQISQITNSTDNITDVAFFNRDNSLAFVKLAFQTSSLYVIDDISNIGNRKEPRQILKNYRSISELVGHPQNNQLFVSLGSNKGSISRLHLLDIQSDKLTPISKITNNNETDSLSKLSPDYQYIANVTFQDNENSVVSIINVNDFQVIKRFNISYHPQDIAWQLGNTSAMQGYLLLINGKQIEQLSISDGSSVSYSNPGYQRLTSNISQKYYYAINTTQSGPTHHVFILRDIHSAAPGMLLKTSSNTRKLYFLNNEYFIELNISENTQSLIATSLDGNKTKTLYSSQKNIKILARSDTLGTLLFSDGEQLLQINTHNFSVSAVTSPAQYVRNGNFNLNGDRIIYTEKKAGRWKLFIYDPKSKSSKYLQDNYLFAYPFSGYYIAMNEEEKLYLLNEDFNVVKNISGSISNVNHSSVNSRELSVPLDFDFISKNNNSNFHPQFVPNLSPDGNSVIIPIEQPNSTQISVLFKS